MLVFYVMKRMTTEKFVFSQVANDFLDAFDRHTLGTLWRRKKQTIEMFKNICLCHKERENFLWLLKKYHIIIAKKRTKVALQNT